MSCFFFRNVGILSFFFVLVEATYVVRICWLIVLVDFCVFGNEDVLADVSTFREPALVGRVPMGWLRKGRKFPQEFLLGGLLSQGQVIRMELRNGHKAHSGKARAILWYIEPFCFGFRKTIWRGSSPRTRVICRSFCLRISDRTFVWKGSPLMVWYS